MAYSTNTELQNNAKITEKTFSGATLTAFLTERIALADKILKVDVGRCVDFSSVPDDETTPIINLLSQYKAAEMALRRVAGIKRRNNENDDISEWERKYKELVELIKTGAITVELSDGTSVSTSVGTFRNTARNNVRPRQGYDKYGEWLNNTDMQEVKGKPSTNKYT